MATSKGTTPSTEVVDIWNRAKVVCFDVDSTVCDHEGIDELGKFLGKGKEVAEFTAKAMTGSMPFEDALSARLDILRPSIADVERYLEQHPPTLSPGILDLVRCLRGRGTEVYLVSGGFRLMIEPVAELLGLPKNHIFANTILFKEDTGEYRDFDRSEFTSHAGGKAEATKHIKNITNASFLAMIGDGATDLEARQKDGADIFIGYGGIIQRESVLSEADWAVYDFAELIANLRVDQ